MKNILAILSLFLSTSAMFSQSMTNKKLDAIYRSVSDTIQGNTGNWQFAIKDVLLVSLTDSTNNRMRIISPIIEIDRLDKGLLKAALVANYHTALDVKYAIADNILWSVFIHPLKELSEEQVNDAISQVYYANVNFGTSFASTSLIFPGNSNASEKKAKKKETFGKKRI